MNHDAITDNEPRRHVNSDNDRHSGKTAPHHAQLSRPCRGAEQAVQLKLCLGPPIQGRTWGAPPPHHRTLSEPLSSAATLSSLTFFLPSISVSLQYPPQLADGVNEPEDEDAGGEYREFDPKDPNFQQEFAEDVDGGKSNLIPFDAR
ncbi:unnamed protein product [Miscanthus lutarioriparius]|uniref:Uncharacterized protein n=1 Tax=Miscanthus lutarioriparius TaxID=422564 RepID=A0A811R521_9POAL|nr:unnamed protein product [Miscanthus lutarioriparius]